VTASQKQRARLGRFAPVRALVASATGEAARLSQLGALLLEPLVRRNGPVGEREPAPLAAPDHQSDGVVEKSAGNSRIFNLAGTFKIVPGNLNWTSKYLPIVRFCYS
jgi:hypothetical protein